MIRILATEMVGPHRGRIARPPERKPFGGEVEGMVIMVAQRRWDNVEQGVKLALRVAAEVVRLIIELRGVR